MLLEDIAFAQNRTTKWMWFLTHLVHNPYTISNVTCQIQFSFQAHPKYFKWVGENKPQASPGPAWSGSWARRSPMAHVCVNDSGTVWWGVEAWALRGPFQRFWSIQKLIWPKVPGVQRPFFAGFTQWPTNELVKSLKQLHSAEAAPRVNMAES